jgi:hypothetical protein
MWFYICEFRIVEISLSSRDKHLALVIVSKKAWGWYDSTGKHKEKAIWKTYWTVNGLLPRY